MSDEEKTGIDYRFARFIGGLFGRASVVKDIAREKVARTAADEAAQATAEFTAEYAQVAPEAVVEEMWEAFKGSRFYRIAPYVGGTVFLIGGIDRLSDRDVEEVPYRKVKRIVLGCTALAISAILYGVGIAGEVQRYRAKNC